MEITLTSEYGYVLALVVAFYVENYVLQVSVVKQRQKTGILAPSLYPRDSEIKALKLSDEAVTRYSCTQRAHQNYLEFVPIFVPLMLIAGLHNPMHTAYAGLVALLGRVITGVGYNTGDPKKRYRGGFFHLGEFYIVYLAAMFSYSLITASS